MRCENVDEKVYKYRKRHTCCNYCKYLEFVMPPYNIAPDYYKCQAKDKIIYFTEILRLCSCYEVDRRDK